jgi:ribonucleoside-diphosphate reductase alpha chain
MYSREPFYWLNKASRLFLERGYLKPGVKAEERYLEIAKHASSILGLGEEFTSRFYNYLSLGYYSLSSPIIANFGNNKGLPISCFGSYVPDSIEGILDTISEIGTMSKIGGGTSAYLGHIRPRGSVITDNGTSNGSFSFLPLFDKTIDVISQGTSRKGQCAAYIDVEHPDFEEWIGIHSEGNPVQLMFWGVVINDVFMSKVKDGDTEARQRWLSILNSRKKTGIPYIMFSDNANNNKPDCYLDIPIYASNLCVAENTQILTKTGYHTIKDLHNTGLVEIWNGEEWSEVEIIKTGENKNLLKVTTNSGYELECTPYHKFYIQKGYEGNGGETIKVEAKNLIPGDKLIKFDLPIIEGFKNLKNAYQNGFYSGDGCLTPTGQRIYLYGEKRKLVEHFSCVENWFVQPIQKRIYGHTNTLKDKYFVPNSEYTIESRLNWLAGYLDADGTVTDNKSSQSIQAASVEKEFLKEIQLMLQTLGVDSKVCFARSAGKYLLPKNNGTRELGEYNCKEANRLLINGNSLFKLSQLGLKCNRLSWHIKKPNRECSQFIKISNVQEVAGLHDTYCFKEQKRGMGMFNGILTGQCNEIMLPSNKDESFVCCLSSMNLEHYEEWKDTDAVETLVYFLDAVMTEFIEKGKKIKHLERAVRFAENHRALGLGVLGWHSYLQKNMIPFDTYDAMSKNAEIFKLIQKKSNKASEQLKELFGPPVSFTKLGRRNTTLMAIAPTKSSSFILGQVSQSIEPIKSNYFIKDLAKIKFPYKNPYLKSLLIELNHDTEEVWDSILERDGSVLHLDFLSVEQKAVFKTFSEISQLAVIQQASQRQKFIDQGQSLNIMCGANVTPKELHEIHFKAWELGLKGLYYQINISAAQEFSRNLLECTACGG